MHLGEGESRREHSERPISKTLGPRSREERGPSYKLDAERVCVCARARRKACIKQVYSNQRGMHQAGIAIREGASHPTCASVRAESMGTLLRKCSAFDASEDAFV